MVTDCVEIDVGGGGVVEGWGAGLSGGGAGEDGEGGRVAGVGVWEGGGTGEGGRGAGGQDCCRFPKEIWELWKDLRYSGSFLFQFSDEFILVVTLKSQNGWGGWGTWYLACGKGVWGNWKHVG